MSAIILLTGATGFIGQRLLPKLLSSGARVRAVSRRRPAQTGIAPHPNLELVQGDALRPEGLDALFQGVDTAYYLIHAMEGGVGDERAFIERDRDAALAFGQAAARAGVRQIIYLSGLAPAEPISAHLQSRNDVERYLGAAGVPVTVLRAGFIIGPGSAGFQMLYGITGTLTTLLVNPELHHVTQPACVDDVIHALDALRALPPAQAAQVLEIGSREVVSYLDIIKLFCAHRGRPLSFLPVPWVPHSVAATYIAAVSGLPYALILALSEGLTIDLPLSHESLYTLLPDLPRTSPDEAMRRAFAELAA